MLFLLVILRGKVTSFCRLHRPNSSQNKTRWNGKERVLFSIFICECTYPTKKDFVFLRSKREGARSPVLLSTKRRRYKPSFNK